MSGPAGAKDLFVLAADQDLANALAGLFARPGHLSMRNIDFDIERHPTATAGAALTRSNTCDRFCEDIAMRWSYSITMAAGVATPEKRFSKTSARI